MQIRPDQQKLADVFAQDPQFVPNLKKNLKQILANFDDEKFSPMPFFDRHEQFADMRVKILKAYEEDFYPKERALELNRATKQFFRVLKSWSDETDLTFKDIYFKMLLRSAKTLWEQLEALPCRNWMPL